MLRSPLPGPSMGFCACALAVEYATGPVGAGATVFRNSSGVVIAENEPARPVLGGGWLAAGPCPVAPRWVRSSRGTQRAAASRAEAPIDSWCGG